jgi:hypothetical protein
MSPTSTSYVGDISLTTTSHAGGNPPATASHVGGIDTIKKPILIRCNCKFSGNICEGYHLTHFFPIIPLVLRLWFLAKGPSSLDSSLVSQQRVQSLVDAVVVSIPSLVDPTLFLDYNVSLEHVVSQPIQLVVEEVVASM